MLKTRPESRETPLLGGGQGTCRAVFVKASAARVRHCGADQIDSRLMASKGSIEAAHASVRCPVCQPCLGALAVTLSLVPQAATAGTLDRVRDSGVFRIGYRADAKPYSYRDEHGQAAGYIVDLCTEVAAALGPNVRAEYVLVPPDDRFEAVRDGTRRHPVRPELDHDGAPRAGRFLDPDLSRRRERPFAHQQAGPRLRGPQRQARRRARGHHHGADAARVDRTSLGSSRPS